MLTRMLEKRSGEAAGGLRGRRRRICTHGGGGRPARDGDLHTATYGGGGRGGLARDGDLLVAGGRRAEGVRRDAPPRPAYVAAGVLRVEDWTDGGGGGREILIFDIEYAGLTRFDIKFAILLKYDTEHANSFKTWDFSSFSQFYKFLSYFHFTGHMKYPDCP